jgi:hypothetical protein
MYQNLWLNPNLYPHFVDDWWLNPQFFIIPRDIQDTDSMQVSIMQFFNVIRHINIIILQSLPTAFA